MGRGQRGGVGVGREGVYSGFASRGLGVMRRSGWRYHIPRRRLSSFDVGSRRHSGGVSG